MHRSPRTTGRLVVVTTCLFLLGVLGCDKKGDAAKAQKAERSSEAKKADQPKKAKVVGGLDEDWRLDNADCTGARKVTAPDPGTPEDTIWTMLEAASGPDNDENFAKFYGTLDPTKYKEEWARTQFWARIRSHVSKYTASSTDATYIICRETKKSGREDYVKFFVYSKDKAKSHPPYGLAKREGKWLIEFFTP